MKKEGDQDVDVAGNKARIEQAEARTEQAEARTEQAEARTEQAETRTEQAETRTEQAKTRAELAETRTGRAEARTELARTRTEKAEIRTEQAETRAEQVETKLQRLVDKEADQRSEISTRPLEKSPLEGGADQKGQLDQLTSRQREILQLIAEGRNTKEIAGILEISPKTVAYHRKHLTDRLNVHDISGLVRLALREGLIPPEG